MRITFEDREWEFDMEAITLKQGVAMHLAYGFNLDAWFEALQETDPRALQCLWWLILQQNGEVVPIKEADCSLIALADAFGEAQDDDKEDEEPEPDPTPPSPPDAPPSPAPPTPTATTPRRPARRRASAPIASTAGI